MTICLLDTSVFCELVQVPNMCQRHREVRQLFEERRQQGHYFLLPMATILETGNHIGQNGDGRQRRAAAERFVQCVSRSLDGQAPWTLTPFPDSEVLREWIKRFPDAATSSSKPGKGMGLGDVSIVDEFHRQCKLNPRRRVFIWSFDSQLVSYDRVP
jgi:hypothetical protein